MKEAANAYPEVHKFCSTLQLKKYFCAYGKNYAADIDIFAGFLKTRYPGGFNWQEVNVLDIRSYLADMNGKNMRAQPLPAEYQPCVLFINTCKEKTK